MEFLLKLALWAHFMGIGLGGAASFGIPVVIAAMPSAAPESRPQLGAIAMRLSVVGRAAMTVLILSGLYMVWASYGLDGLNVWFWIKMLLVAALIVLVVYNTRNGARARAGDMAAAARAPMLARIGMGVFAAIIAAAVLTFL